MPIRYDLIDVMKKVGQVPFSTLQESLDVILDSKNTKKLLAMDVQNLALKDQEIGELKDLLK